MDCTAVGGTPQAAPSDHVPFCFAPRLPAGMNPLPAAVTQGHFGFNRQTLVGGNYELLDTGTLAPNPDFWVAALFTSMMGSKVLKLEVRFERAVCQVLGVSARCLLGRGTEACAQPCAKCVGGVLDVCSVGAQGLAAAEHHTTMTTWRTTRPSANECRVSVPPWCGAQGVW